MGKQQEIGCFFFLVVTLHDILFVGILTIERR